MQLTLKEQLGRQTLLGTFVTLTDLSVPALLRRAGLELIVVDTEHFLLNPETVRSLILAARAAGLRCLVRVAEISRAAIQPVLDADPDGILVPLVNSVADAQRAVEFARYSPQGSRGFHGLTPATGWGAVNPADHTQHNAERVFVALQIETPAGVAASAEIAQVDGFDMLFVGPGDLSQSLGMLGKYDDPQLLTAIENALSAARKNARLTGIYAARPNLEELARSYGACLILRGSDARFLMDGARHAAGEHRG